jgi:hypothetical protein
MGFDKVERDFAGLPIFSCVRNPWDWYVSSYHYLLESLTPEDEGPMWEQTLERGKATFEEVVTRCCTGERFANPRTRPVMRRRGLDHYSAMFWMIAGRGVEAGRVEVGRFEDLAGSFIAFLERHGVPVPGALRDDLRDEAPIGSSERGAYRDYYDEALRDLVAAGAAELIADYGYSF